MLHIAAGKAARKMINVAFPAAFDFSPKSSQLTKILGNYCISQPEKPQEK